MLPLRDANPTRRTPIVTLVIIAANVAAFLFWQPTFASGELAPLEQQTFFWCHAAIPFEVSHQANLASGGAAARAAIDGSYERGFPLQQYLRDECPDKSWLQSVFVAMFLHGGWLHLLGNMLFLWVFGDNVEDRLGKIGYVLFYVAGGVAAFALQLALDPNSAIPTLGASGAIAAVLGAYIVAHPRARVLTLVFFFFITLIELPAFFVLGIWFVLQLFSGVGQIGSEVNAGVAYWAHVGGFAFGLLMGFLLLRRGRGGGAFGPVPPPPIPL
ncbi:MAG TPA: rhomboid family intramembrane serine protease [Actinomycetota bacterium]|jgi:membrane associated rhomboid family serine protease|nr:rhomboid family intramembrane serine protease [Actinomycetota bacterium]